MYIYSNEYSICISRDASKVAEAAHPHQHALTREERAYTYTHPYMHPYISTYLYIAMQLSHVMPAR